MLRVENKKTEYGKILTGLKWYLKIIIIAFVN